MKNWILRGLVLALLIAGVAWGWKTFFPGPEKAIRQTLANVARLASVPAREGELARIANARELTGFFTPDTQISVDIPGQYAYTITGRDDLLRTAILARSTANGLKVDLVDVSVRIAPDKRTAEARFTGKAQSPTEGGLQAQEMQASFIKDGTHWLINRLETVRTLR